MSLDSLLVPEKSPLKALPMPGSSMLPSAMPPTERARRAMCKVYSAGGI
ncbi:hypothetical protein [Blastochloris tepida]|nr:hypothetical protein [Blastochloris tepida]